MEVAYRTVVGAIEFVVYLRNYEDYVDVEISPINVVPTPGSVSTTVPKSDTLEQFLDRYTKFILKAVSDITNSINHLECELLAPETVLPEACEKCAYWGNPTDTANKRVCRYWDIPERECFTGPHEHCSQGYVSKNDVVDVVDVEPPTIKKIFTTATPDSRHSYFNKYLTELYDLDHTLSRADIIPQYTGLEMLQEVLDKSEET